MEEVKGKLCFGYNRGAKIPFAVRLEIHQEDCPHIDDPIVAEEELHDYVACLTLGSGEEGLTPLCPYVEEITYNVDEGTYLCKCK